MTEIVAVTPYIKDATWTGCMSFNSYVCRQLGIDYKVYYSEPWKTEQDQIDARNRYLQDNIGKFIIVLDADSQLLVKKNVDYNQILEELQQKMLYFRHFTIYKAGVLMMNIQEDHIDQVHSALCFYGHRDLYYNNFHYELNFPADHYNSYPRIRTFSILHFATSASAVLSKEWHISRNDIEPLGDGKYKNLRTGQIIEHSIDISNKFHLGGDYL